MVTFVVIFAMGLAGYLNVSAWLVPAGAACLTLDDWRLWRLGRQTRAAWTPKTTTYFLTGVLADLVLATLSFGAGRIVRVLLG